jgi:McrBC 5-methylcytosine restriction system component
VSQVVNIPIQNIYYLLCYAWDKLAERDVIAVIAVEAIDMTTLADLFARVLINGTNHLLKRGFDRGYLSQHEWTGRLRGRICFQEAIRRNARATGRLPCDFDELSYNVLHNCILKATMRRLIRTQGLAAECSESLTQLCRLFLGYSGHRIEQPPVRPGAAPQEQPVLRFSAQGLRTDLPQPARVPKTWDKQVHGIYAGRRPNGAAV